MNRLAKIIKEMPLEDLQLIKQDLDAGHISKLIDARVKEMKDNRIKHCPVCSAPIKEKQGINIEFGPADFRKRATFDGPDCLSYFMQNMKK